VCLRSRLGAAGRRTERPAPRSGGRGGRGSVSDQNFFGYLSGQSLFTLASTLLIKSEGAFPAVAEVWDGQTTWAVAPGKPIAVT
jgi:hypothetical protein